MKALVQRSISKRKTYDRAPRFMSLPPELWIAIFEDGGLSVKDISNTRLTCTLFAALAKALAFSCYTFWVRLDRRQANLSPMPTLSVDSLKYWTSDSIAPLVRRCIIRPIFVITNSPYTPDSSFPVLTHFTNLQYLECRHIPFSDLALSRLCQLKGIRTLVVDGCIITASAAPPMLKVTDIHFKSSIPVPSRTYDRGQLGWLDILRPEHIRRVHFDFANPHSGVSDLRGIMTTRSPALRSGGAINCMYHHLALVVSHPTMLQELVIEGWWGVSMTGAAYPKSLIPLQSLCVYDGPSQILDWFTTGTQLRTFILDRSEHADPEAVMLRLHRRLQPIHRLAIHITKLTHAFIETISFECIRLEHLSIRAKWIDEEAIIALAASSLLPTIRTLSLGSYYRKPVSGQVGWFQTGFLLRHDVFVNHPDLQQITFARHEDFFEWNRRDFMPKIEPAIDISRIQGV